MNLRWLAVLLLLANLGYLAWAQGWLAPALPPPRAQDSEPARLDMQHQAGAVAVLPPAAASAAVSAARAAARRCLEAGPLLVDGSGAGATNGSAAGAAAALAARADLPADSWALDSRPAPRQWWISAGRYPEAPARRAREAELRQLGLEFSSVAAPAADAASAWPGLADITPALVVSRHTSAEAAELALQALPPAARRSLRIVAVPPGPAEAWLRVAQADSELQTRLAALDADAVPGGGFKPCERALAAAR